MNGFALNNIQNAYVGSTQVSAIYLGSTLIWPTGPQPVPYDQQYLTFEALEPVEFEFTHNDLQYSLDDGTTWNTLTVGTRTPMLAVGGKIMWKQTGLTPSSSYGIGTFNAYGSSPLVTSHFKAYGNVMSLYYGDNFVGETDLTNKDWAFHDLFYGCEDLLDAENVILPATTLSEGCYRAMFYGCAYMTTVPLLPATSLRPECYSYMFYGCTHLITVPNNLLPATSFAYGAYGAYDCYEHMFTNCTRLTTAPALPATTLADNCYVYMFFGCTALVNAPTLPATTILGNCYENMFANCTSLVTAPALPATTLSSSCYSGMFAHCTSLVNAPTTLPATTLTDGCYYGMFYDCTSLVTAPELPASILVSSCYYRMFYGCTSLNYIKCLATDITASGCTTDWVDGVASSGTFVKDASMTSWTTGNDGIPTNWTVRDDVLPYDQQYLTFEALEPTTFTFSTNDVQYSLDNGTTWTTLAANTASPQLAVGDKILWKQTGLTPTSTAGIGTFSATGNYKAYGNVMSLYYGDNFIGQTSLSGKNYAFRYLFSGNTKLVNAENLILPATTLANNCYQYMFQNCTSLTSAPVLPATTLASNCYSYMFRGCTSLTTAPDLLATTSAGSCYVRMFNGCTSLRYIKCLLSKYSLINTTYWVENVAASGTFVKNPSTTNWSTGTSGIPSGWTVQDAT